MAATIKCDTLQNTSSATANVTLDGSGNVTAGNNLTITGQTIPSSSFKRNHIINGAFDIFQRAASLTNVTSGAAGYTGPDRFFIYQNGTVSVQTAQNSSTVPTGFKNCLQWGRASGQTNTGVTAMGQCVESINSYDVRSNYVTLSFYAKAGSTFSSASSVLNAYVYTGTGTDEGSAALRAGTWTGQATVISQSPTLTTSWQRFSYTSAAVCGATVSEIAPFFSWTPVGTASTDDYVYITGVQLEVGSAATPYERQIYSDQLAQCQRYLPVISITNGWNFIGQCDTTTSAHYCIAYPVTTRVAATGVSISGSLIGTTAAGSSAGSTFSFNTSSTDHGAINLTSATGLVAGNASMLSTSSGTATIQFTGCEL